jgi:hypothetical protein
MKIGYSHHLPVGGEPAGNSIDFGRSEHSLPQSYKKGRRLQASAFFRFNVNWRNKLRRHPASPALTRETRQGRPPAAFVSPESSIFRQTLAALGLSPGRGYRVLRAPFRSQTRSQPDRQSRPYCQFAGPLRPAVASQRGLRVFGARPHRAPPGVGQRIDRSACAAARYPISLSKLPSVSATCPDRTAARREFRPAGLPLPLVINASTNLPKNGGRSLLRRTSEFWRNRPPPARRPSQPLP